MAQGWWKAAAASTWLLLAASQSYVAAGCPRPPGWSAHATNFAVLALIAVATTHLAARVPWLGHPLLPAAVALGPILVGLGPDDAFGLALYALGAVFTLGLLLLRAPPHPAWLVVTLPGVLGAPALERVLREGGAMGILNLNGNQALLAELTWVFKKDVDLPPARDVGPPVVVISIDTLRADEAERMISFRQLEARGARWSRATSTSSWTLPALASLQTGQLPAAHGADCQPSGPCTGLSSRATPLAESLQERGYRTAAFVSNSWVSRTTAFDRGFQDFHAKAGLNVDLPFDLRSTPAEALPEAGEIIDEALQWLDGNRHPSFYLWIHLIDPHLPYLNAEDPSFRTLLGSDLRNGFAWSEERQSALRAAYRQEVERVDLEVSRLITYLERTQILDRGIVVLTSDHGEEFWEHGGIEHGHSHHAEVIEVPLALVAPDLQVSGRRSDLASLVDVASTVRAAVGLPAEGVDLRAPIPADRAAFAWGNLFGAPACSGWDAERHLLASPCTPDAAASYHRTLDPTERWPQPVAAEDPLAAELPTLRPQTSDAEAMDPGAGLRALGYVD